MKKNALEYVNKLQFIKGKLKNYNK